MLSCNKKRLILSVSLLLLTLSAVASVPTSPDMKMSYKWADDKLKELTLDEKLDFTVGYQDFFFPGITEKGIPFLYLSDATKGLHLRPELKDTVHVRQLERSTAFPAPIMLAATFNPSLAYEYGEAVGEECRAGGVALLLGPGVNLARNAQCGRNYEYLGEDPYLVGNLAASYIKGIQSTGTAACIKHFIANETEFYRRRTNSILDDRTLHEIYMRPFRDGIDAGVAFIMTSYNKLNGEWTGESSFAIDTLIRRDLGFKGCVISDWRSVYDNRKTVKSGQNVIMPGSPEIRDEIAAMVRNGQLTETDIDNMIRPLLATCHAYGLYDPDRKKYDTSLLDKFPAHEQVSLRTAEEGVVLLKNNGILPLDNPKGKKILVTGNYLDKDFNKVGASADVVGYNQVTWRQALEKEFGGSVEFVAKPTDKQIAEADVVIVSTGTVDREAYERPFDLPSKENRFIKKITSINPNTVVVVFTGSGVGMNDFAEDAAAIIYGWYPGQNGMQAVSGVIAGRVNPSGKLPLTIEKSFSDSPARDLMPAGAKFYTHLFNERMIMPYDIPYKEGVMMGYRWYDSQDIEPLFPFGHGLTYTDWEIVKPTVKVKDGKVTVKGKVKNTGKREGAQVVQVYVTEKNPTVARPPRELKGIAKITAAPGTTASYEIEIPVSDLGFYDEATHAFRTNPGDYILSVGTSSRDLPHLLPLTIK